MPPPAPRKGAALELLFEKWLLANNWRVHRSRREESGDTPRGRFRLCNDIFRCFDFLSFKQLPYGPFSIMLAQTCTDASEPRRRKKIEAGAPWPPTWRVCTVRHVVRVVDGDAAHTFALRTLLSGRSWSLAETNPFNLRALEAMRVRSVGARA